MYTSITKIKLHVFDIFRSELGMNTYSHPPQIRRQYMEPYKPVYIKSPAYHYSVPRNTRVYRQPSNADSFYRVYRQPSNAESYTLSRPPGRAQPIRIVQQESQPIMTSNLEDITATHLMEYGRQRNTYSRPEPAANNFRDTFEDELVIEAALEPPQEVLAPSAPKYSRSSRTHVKDIQYHHPRDTTTATSTSNAGGVEISPVQPEAGAHESEEWQEVSLYVRRPSLEDVRRVRPQMTENNPNPIRSPAVTVRAQSNVHSHRMETTSTRTHSYGQRISTKASSPSKGQNYVIRTTIPREPQPRQKPVPLIMVNDEAMQF